MKSFLSKFMEDNNRQLRQKTEVCYKPTVIIDKSVTSVDGGKRSTGKRNKKSISTKSTTKPSKAAVIKKDRKSISHAAFLPCSVSSVNDFNESYSSVPTIPSYNWNQYNVPVAKTTNMVSAIDEEIQQVLNCTN